MHARCRPALLVYALTAAAATSVADSPLPGRQSFDELFATIKPQSGESPWMEVDWHPSVWEARKRAAAEGKPIFLMAGSGGAPAAGC